MRPRQPNVTDTLKTLNKLRILLWTLKIMFILFLCVLNMNSKGPIKSALKWDSNLLNTGNSLKTVEF